VDRKAKSNASIGDINRRYYRCAIEKTASPSRRR